MANKIQLRRDTAANWTSTNPTLSQGEQGYETDTGKLKIGDGSTAWTSLGYSFGAGGDTGIDFDDNVKARFGTGNDLEIYHNGSSSIIENTSAGQYLRIRSAGGIQFTTSGTENALVGIQDNKVGLYYDGSEKLETTSTGVQTTGTVNVNGAYTLPTSDGTSGQVLTTDGAGAVTFAAAGGGGADLYAANESSPTAQPSATGANAVAIGDQAIASGNDSLAFGEHSDATATRSYAFGFGAVATTTGALALGTSRAFAGDAVAINVDNNSTSYGASGANSIAMGYQAKATFQYGLALGAGTQATNTNAFSAGYYSTASGQRSTALGWDATASGADAIAIGRDTDATSTESVALGRYAQAAGQRAVSLGHSYASGTDSFAAGIASSTNSFGATGNYSAAIGYRAKTTATDSLAIGQNALASGSRSTAISKSYTSGNDSFAAAIANNTSSYGATGTNSIAMGYQSKATGLYSASLGGSQNTSSSSYAITAGSSNTASATRSIAIGGHSNEASGSYSAILGGIGNTASGDFSRAGGYYADTQNIDGKDAYASYSFFNDGDQQRASLVLFCDTTDATAEALRSNTSAAGTTNQVILPNNSAYSFSGTIIARESAAAGSDYASWEIKGALLRDANAASTVLGNGIQNKLYATSGASAWAIALSADTTNGGLKIEVTGAAATNIRWVATVNTSEVTYA